MNVKDKYFDKMLLKKIAFDSEAAKDLVEPTNTTDTYNYSNRVNNASDLKQLISNVNRSMFNKSH